MRSRGGGWRRWGMRCLCGMGALALGLLLVAFAQKRGSNRDLEAFRQRMQARGLPANWEEWLTWNTLPTDPVHNGPSLLAVLEQVPQIRWDTDENSLPVNPILMRELREILSSSPRLPNRYGESPMDMDGTQLMLAKRGTQTLATAARQAMNEGYPELAVENVVAVFRLGQAVSQHAALIDWLVQLAIQSIGLNVLEDVLGRSSLSEDELRSLMSVLDLELDRAPERLQRSWVGEFCFGSHMFEHPTLVSELSNAPLSSMDDFGSVRTMLARFAEALLLAALFPTDYRAYREQFEHVYGLAARPDRATYLEVGSIPLSRWAVRTRMMNPAHRTAYGKYLRFVAQLRAARLALAVEGYRQQHDGAFPATLADLVPDFIQALPLDPLEDPPAPLKFHRFDGGYMVYCVGWSFETRVVSRESDPDLRWAQWNSRHDIGFVVRFPKEQITEQIVPSEVSY